MSFHAHAQRLSDHYLDDEHPAKSRRVSRACLQCRARKQRCSPSCESANLKAPCQRCQKLAITCSFETDTTSMLGDTASPSSLAQLVVDLHRRIIQHETRIIELEKKTEEPQQFSELFVPEKHVNRPDLEQTSLSPPEPTQFRSPVSSIDAIDLGAPIATLRSLRELAKDESTPSLNPVPRIKHGRGSFDPISHGILSMDDVQAAIDIFFDHCHSSAPVLSEGIRHSWHDPNLHSSTLILAICLVGARFWHKGRDRATSPDSFHPRYNDLTALLDKAVSRLLLHPTPSDATLDSIRVLLLYAQWMPYNVKDENVAEDDCTTTKTQRSRYNEISAWAILGLAERYALLLGLDKSATSPFEDAEKVPSEEDMSRLRVWYNLLTCSFNLMLTSGLPTSIDPTLSAHVSYAFSSNIKAQYPSDLRVSGLVELVAIVHRTMRSCGDVSGHRLQSGSLTKLNSDLSKWESSWAIRLWNTESQHNQLPFNSVRWYRLSLNSASLTPLLSTQPQPRPPAQSPESSLREALETSLTAAAQIILSLSTYNLAFLTKVNSQNLSTFPIGLYHIDPVAIPRLYYAVDSTWISHTFAVTFLVLCYIRGIVDENLQVHNCVPYSPTNSNHLPPSSSSIIAKLLYLVLGIFDNVCSSEGFHSARDFQGIVHYATSLVLGSDENEQGDREQADDLAIRSLLELMNESGVDWAGGLLGPSNDLNEWGANGFFDVQ